MTVEIVWSPATAASGLAANFTQLFLARAVVGAGESVNGPTAYSMVADSFPDRAGRGGRHERAVPLRPGLGTVEDPLRPRAARMGRGTASRRLVVEGLRGDEAGRDRVAECANPSTALRAVPLPIRLRRRERIALGKKPFSYTPPHG